MDPLAYRSPGPVAGPLCQTATAERRLKPHPPSPAASSLPFSSLVPGAAVDLKDGRSIQRDQAPLLLLRRAVVARSPGRPGKGVCDCPTARQTVGSERGVRVRFGHGSRVTRVAKLAPTRVRRVDVPVSFDGDGRGRLRAAPSPSAIFAETGAGASASAGRHPTRWAETYFDKLMMLMAD